MTTTPAPLDLDAIRKRAQEAWIFKSYWSDERRYSGDVLAAVRCAKQSVHSDVPALLDELAKTRAELAEAEQAREKLTLTVRAFPHAANAANIAHARAQRDEYYAELGKAKARISAAATVEVWTNEDGKRFVFADDLMRALDPNPEANPATTAEPADEPKATTRQPICGDPYHRHSGCCDRWTPIGTRWLCRPGCPVHPKGLAQHAEPAAS